jgi:hypothetical protein
MGRPEWSSVHRRHWPSIGAPSRPRPGCESNWLIERNHRAVSSHDNNMMCNILDINNYDGLCIILIYMYVYIYIWIWIIYMYIHIYIYTVYTVHLYLYRNKQICICVYVMKSWMGWQSTWWFVPSRLSIGIWTTRQKSPYYIYIYICVYVCVYIYGRFLKWRYP